MTQKANKGREIYRSDEHKVLTMGPYNDGTVHTVYHLRKNAFLVTNIYYVAVVHDSNSNYKRLIIPTVYNYYVIFWMF